MSRTTTSSQRLWAIWADFDDDGEPTDRTIIGDSDGRAVFCTVEATPGEIAYGPKTRSAESQVQPRVTSPSETSGFASRRVSRKLHGSHRSRQNRGHGAYLRRASRS